MGRGSFLLFLLREGWGGGSFLLFLLRKGWGGGSFLLFLLWEGWGGGAFSPFSFERGKGRGSFLLLREGCLSSFFFWGRDVEGCLSSFFFWGREEEGGWGGDFSPFSFQGGKEGRLFSFSVVRSSSVSGAHSAKPRYPAAVNQYLGLASRGDTICIWRDIKIQKQTNSFWFKQSLFALT